MSRRACPSPIGDETNRARRRLCRALAHRTAPADRELFGTSLSTNSRIRRLTLTGSRASGTWPAAIEDREPTRHCPSQRLSPGQRADTVVATVDHEGRNRHPPSPFSRGFRADHRLHVGQ